MARRLVISAVLAVLLVVVQLAFAHATIGIALVSGVVAFVVAFLVLLVSDRWFTRSGRG